MKHKPMTPEECAAVNPQTVDSVTADRLLATIKHLREHAQTMRVGDSDASIMKAAVWLASMQGELEEAAQWIFNETDQWIGEETWLDEWAHDWRAFWTYHRPKERGGQRLCGVCQHPATTYNRDLAACSTRHVRALRGELGDEQCRVCNKITVCAFESAGSPICADCYPKDRLLAERRAAWAARFQ